MALISLGSGGEADQIGSGPIGKRPPGEAGLIRHVTSTKDKNDEPGSTIEFWDPATAKWQQLASYYDVEGVEIVAFSFNLASYFTDIPPAPGRDVAGEVIIPPGFDRFFVVTTCSVENQSDTILQEWGGNSIQATLMTTSPRKDRVGFNAIQFSPNADIYAGADKRTISVNGEYSGNDYTQSTIFQVHMNLGINPNSAGGYIHAQTTDVNLAVLAWRTAK